MTRHILNRCTQAVIWTGEAETIKDALHQALAAGADLRGAVLTGANLTDADLRGAVLTGADLTGADLRGADLRGAVLTGADLRGADLTGAVLTGAVLTGADIPVVPQIDAAILAAIQREGCSLDMGNWHTCETTHCRAGWAIHLAGAAGRELEARYGPAAAGALIYAASRPGERVPNFYASTDEALDDLRACAARQAGGQSVAVGE